MMMMMMMTDSYCINDCDDVTHDDGCDDEHDEFDAAGEIMILVVSKGFVLDDDKWKIV